MVDIARLQPNGAARRIEHPRSDAIGTESVDDLAVADLPEKAPELFRRLDEQEIVELVEIPFVVEERVEHALARGQLRRHFGMQHVIIISDGETDNREQEWREFDPDRQFFGPCGLMSINRGDRLAPKIRRQMPDEMLIEQHPR